MSTVKLGILIVVILGIGALIPLSSEEGSVSLTCTVPASAAGQPTDLSELDVPCVLKEEVVVTTRQYYGLMTGSETSGREISRPLESVANEIIQGNTTFPERQVALCVSAIEISLETGEGAEILTREDDGDVIEFTCIPIEE